MKVATTAIRGLLLLEPAVHEDARGFFFESFNQKRFDDATGLATASTQTWKKVKFTETVQVPRRWYKRG
jgi:dTDP-4-dehydrorhamnose 3,5-epimerase-like enzyme